MPVTRFTFPCGCTKCIFDMILPTSLVRVANTSTVLKQGKYIKDQLMTSALLNLLGKCKQTDIVFGIRSQFGEANEIDAVFLGVKTGWKVIAVSLIVAVVETKKNKNENC